jgi:hypothetical protein
VRCTRQFDAIFDFGQNARAVSFVLMVAGELPGDPEVEKPYSLEEVFE